MPRRYRSSRRSYGRRSNRRYTGTVRARPGYVIGPRALATLRYHEQLSLTGLQDVNSFHMFNLNSLYDPDRTATGHQPLGYDQYSVLYSRYKVISCAWKVTIQSAQGSPTVWTVGPVVGAAVSSAPVTWVEQPHFRTRCVAQSTGGPSITVIKGVTNLARFAGLSSTEYYGDPEYAGATGNFGVGTSPNVVLTLLITGKNSVGFTGTWQASVMVEMMYYTIFDLPQQLATS